MECSCVRQTDLPHTSRLFADAVYHPDRVARFYPHPLRDLDSYRAAAAEVDLPDDRRAALVEALLRLNGPSPSLDLLAKPGTVAVVTGQQVGLFSGPSYTVYKALTAAKIAAWLNANGVPAAPVFWLATEDHDFAEVNHAFVFDAEHRPVRLQMQRQANGQPVGGVTLAAPPIDGLRAALAGLPFGDEVSAMVAESYGEGAEMGAAFQALLKRLLGKYGLLFVDPMAKEFRELAAPALRKALALGPQLTEDLLARNHELAAAGYHAQVHVEPHTSLVFLLENGKRLALRRQGEDYFLAGRKLTAAELSERAASLSPNALLRPVAQDWMLPTVAYVGGPAEVAYLAQSATLYRRILGRQPLAIPRAGFTVLDARSHKLTRRYGLDLPAFYGGEAALRERIGARLVPPALASTMRAATATVDETVAGLERDLAAFDPSLAAALARSASKVRYQFQKMERKVDREVIARDQRATAAAASLYGLVYPEKHLQERLYSFLPFVAKHGPDLIDQVYEAVELDCPDHRILVA
jgi:bacillithiol biosynthesis cysteine-adding enzyme BshC